MHGNLERIYYPQPVLMQYLSDETKMIFLDQVNRESINDKINGLLDELDNFYMEMIHFMKLKKLGFRYNNKVLVYLRNLCLFISFIINLLLLINDTTSRRIVTILGVINIILYAIIVFIWLLYRMYLEYQKISQKVRHYIQLNVMKKKNRIKKNN